MEIKHHFIVHLIDMITRQDQHIFRIVTLHVVQVLVDRIRRPCIPFAVDTLLIRRKHRHTADIPVKIPGNTDPDMGIETKRLILRQHTHGVNTRIDTVTERKVDDPVFAAERYSRFCNLRRKHTQSASLTAC